MSDGGIKTINPDAQKYVEPTLQQYSDFPKNKIHNLKMPSFKELTPEDKKAFLKNACITLAVNNIVQLLATLIMSGNQCAASPSNGQSTAATGSLQLQNANIYNNQQHYSFFQHSHLLSADAVQQGFFSDMKGQFWAYLLIIEAYLGVGCNSFLIQSIVGGLFVYGISYYKDNYPDDYDNYFSSSPMDTTMTNVMSGVKAVFLSAMGCYLGNIQIIFYTIILIILIFLVHALYTGISLQNYSRTVAYLLCLLIGGLMFGIMMFRNNVPASLSNQSFVQTFENMINTQTLKALVIASLIGVMFSILIIKVMNDKMDDINFDFDIGNIMGFVGGFDISLLSAPLLPLLKITSFINCCDNVFGVNCYKEQDKVECSSYNTNERNYELQLNDESPYKLQQQ